MTDREAPEAAESYWYDEDAQDVERAVEVLRALRRFKAADSAMRAKTQADMDMNETDLLALRYLIAAEAREHPVGPKELAQSLSISSAATAKLLARLTRSGHIVREPHPTDRRAQILHPSPDAHHEVRKTLGDMHERMLFVAQSYAPAEQRVIISFLDALSDAVKSRGESNEHASHAGSSHRRVSE